ncbi:MAG: kelch repeat-containing protein [Balneolaceae bacterium]|nr:kelch repeat-containing protein [Balneolaceae bacterium]MDR9407616.1 kelch repeat-containing protein [Balneolaceae bacterium]
MDFKSLIISLLFAILAFFPTQVTAQTYNWHTLEAYGSATERHENALIQAGNKFILIGGRGMKPVDIYDTQTNEWTEGAQPPFEIHHIQAVELHGLVYVVGAMTGGWPYETPLSHILIYDPVLDKWGTGSEIPENRRRGAAGTVVYNGKIYVACGIINGHTSGWVSWLDEFDPKTNLWRELPNAPRSRDHLHAAVVDDKLVVAGGRRSGYGGGGFETTISETNIYDFDTGEWTELPSPDGDIPTERAGIAAAVHQNNVVIIGGESGSQQTAHNEVEVLDLSNGTWESLPSLNRGRHGTQAINIGDMLVVGAGSGDRGGGPELTSFEVFSNIENPEFPNNPLTKAELTVLSESISFSGGERGGKEVILSSQNGNQASLISYIQLDNTTDFELDLPMKTPFILAPGQNIPIDVTWIGNRSGDSEATLFIKPLGNAEPLSVEVKAIQ